MLATLSLLEHPMEKWQAEQDKLKKLYKWGTWESDSFTLCGVRYLQKKDYSIVMDQQEFTRKLSTAEFNLPKHLYKINCKTKLDAAGLKIASWNEWLITMALYKLTS